MDYETDDPNYDPNMGASADTYLGYPAQPDITMTLKNFGTIGAVLDVNSLVWFDYSGNALFTFKGGTFPGTGGTCTPSGGYVDIAAGASCTIVVTYDHANVAATSMDSDGMDIPVAPEAAYIGQIPADQLYPVYINVNGQNTDP